MSPHRAPSGTGGKADAYLAVHRGAGHDVVLKFLRSSDPDEALRFTREAMLLQTFNHPALPRFYDYAPQANPPYIAMAHAPGRPALRLCSPPRLRAAEVAAVGVKLAEVVAVVHARGVLHRDINANNVLIDERGAVTLLDFGCAHLDEQFYNVPAGERRYLTPPEAREVIPDGGIGTLAWSAPEVHAGSGWTDKSDVYSIGHLLYRLLTGKVPVKGADPPTSPQILASACPDDLAAAVVKTLQVDPRHRPTAAQLAQTLLDVLESEEEALARVLAAAPTTGRPALRLVPAGPHVPAEWTEHPIPDATSEPEPNALPGPPPPSAGAVMTGPRTRALRIAAGLAALGVAGWCMYAATRPVSSDLADNPAPTLRDPALLASSGAGRPTPPTPTQQPALLASTAPEPPLPTMLDALDEVGAALRHCSTLAGGLLMVEFTTLEKRDTFDRVAVSGTTNPDLDRCVREATVDLHFQPRHAETFTKEYSP